MQEKICFMIGNADTPDSAQGCIDEAVLRHIAQQGITEFVVGQRGCFDRMAARAVIKAKQLHPHVRLTLLLAYLPTKKMELPAGFDGSLYPDGMESVPRRLAIVRANQYMARHCDAMIACLWHTQGNSARIADVARGAGVPLTQLGPVRD